LRFFGIKEQKDEDCRRAVCNVVNDKIKVAISPVDISAAHRLPKPPTQQQKPTIVKFKDRTQRQDILKRRKVLKGTGISVSEDMTKENVKLVQEADGPVALKQFGLQTGRFQRKTKEATNIYWTYLMKLSSIEDEKIVFSGHKQLK
jgi:hypothetical protein